MRLSAPTLIICAALAAVWARAALPPGHESGPDPRPAAQAARAGLSARLAELGAAPLGAASAQTGADGLWRLRGRAARTGGPAEGWPAPLYAEARAVCDSRLARADCWRVLRLELDGEPRALREPGG